LPGIPVDPDGHPYKLSPEGRVEVRVPDDFPFATKGLPPGLNRIRSSTASRSNPHRL